MRKKKQFEVTLKIEIISDYLDKKLSVSELIDKYNITEYYIYGILKEAEIDITQHKQPKNASFKKAKNIFKCCTCSKEFVRKPCAVKNPNSVFCSQQCYKDRPKIIHKTIDESYIGRTNHLLIIESFAGFVDIPNNSRKKKTSSERSWNCKCSCGNTVVYTSAEFNTRKSCGCIMKLPQHGHLFNPDRLDAVCLHNFHKYQQGAKKRNLSFTLTLEHFKDLITSPCHYCNRIIPNKNRFEMDEDIAVVGVDRKDSNRGYEIDNCLPCCCNCNYMKRDQSYDNFLTTCKLISENHAQYFKKSKSKLPS